jgi:Uma2 family endonuclease
MVAERRHERVTVDEWRALERASHDVKHEYIDGYLYAMAGGTGAHMAVASNIVIVLRPMFGDGPCIAYPLDMATRLSASRYTYPDVVVTCSERDQPSPDLTEVTEPRVVFEVLSPSTERRDRGRKWDYYRQCASLQEYVLVGTEYQRVEVYRRTDQGWSLFSIYGPDDTVELTSIDVGFSVASIYQRSGVPVIPADEEVPHETTE